MQKFFIEEVDFNNHTLPNDLIYQASKVLRYQINDQFIIGVNNKNYLVRITKINLKELTYEIVEELAINNELDIKVTIIEGYPKGDKFEEIIKHSTELGAYGFIPCLMERTQFKIDQSRWPNKIERFNKIIKEASEQSMRNIIPYLTNFKKLKEIDFSTFKYVFVCYEEMAKQGEIKGFKETLKTLNINDNIAFIIGPEGGISPSEIEFLKTIPNTIFISLGKRILRCETAPYYCLSAVSYERELI